VDKSLFLKVNWPSRFTCGIVAMANNLSSLTKKEVIMPYPKLSAPTICQVEITTQCSLNCFHCYNFWRNKVLTESTQNWHKKTMTPEEGAHIVSKLAKAGVFDVTFTGGEPLMAYNVLKRCMLEANMGGIRVHLNSNLLCLTTDRAKELHDMGLKSIVTSFMGPDAKSYDTIAQRKGTFSRVVRGIEIAQNAGLSVIANMVVSRMNQHQVLDTARFVHSIGINRFSATKASCPANCYDFSSLGLTVAEFRQYLNDLSLAGETLGIKVDALEGYPLCGVKDLAKHHFANHRRCTAGINSMAIGSDGNVRPCSHFDTVYGNLLTEDLSVVWDRFSDWRAGMYLPPVCKSCKLLGVCGGGCRMEAKMRSGNVSGPDPYCVPEDVDSALTSLQIHISSQHNTDLDILGGAVFSVQTYRQRSEPFGLTIRIEGNPHMYLSHKGAQVFRQLIPNTPYIIGDSRINWGPLNPLDFVRGLIASGSAKLLTQK
jgi:radical SAM protein with 4Fe4S-binding SPASM domain